MNLTVVRGHLGRPASLRDLGDGRRVLSFDIVADTEPRGGSVPVAWNDPPASAETLDEGEEVVVIGRVRRRFFRAGGSTQSRTEIEAAVVLRARQRARVKRALAEAAEELDEAMAGAG
jgi:single-strand DNA-binding protein